LVQDEHDRFVVWDQEDQIAFAVLWVQDDWGVFPVLLVVEEDLSLFLVSRLV
jgi:hypothetical protein